MHCPHWCGISVVLLVLTIIYASQASTCPETVYDFYEAAGCKELAPHPISGCVTEYNCSMIRKTSEDQCFRNGKIYDEGTVLSVPEDCDTSCRCRSGQFSCPVVDCPFLWESPIPPDCVTIYGDGCCERDVVCSTYGFKIFLK
ncbi:hypothetical protein AMK59_5854 [Oryctes borbonicus]|uniref:VWFC domain-containing protein n=1 Tax=Oryctes borbonicus TaxID=1629725 RepID=A0A0T6B2J9_9SCAR|nr:hypothetical protein AMK59_5854 [Oryctes borbonicus]